jgi:hypothetical protein
VHPDHERGAERAVDAIADAARAALLLALGLMVAALLFRSDTGEFGRGWGNQLAHLFDARLAYGPSIPGSFVGGFVFLFLPLAAVVGVRRDLWSERHRRLSEVLVPPLYGLGGAVGSHGSDGSSTTSEYHHLGYVAGQDWGLWAAPVVALLVIGAATVVVARRTRDDGALPASLLTWVGLLLVTTPAFVWLTSARAGISSNGERASGAEGVHGWLAALLLPLAGLVCAAVVARSRGVLDLGRVREIGRRLQSDPSRSSAEG